MNIRNTPFWGNVREPLIYVQLQQLSCFSTLWINFWGGMPILIKNTLGSFCYLNFLTLLLPPGLETCSCVVVIFSCKAASYSDTLRGNLPASHIRMLPKWRLTKFSHSELKPVSVTSHFQSKWTSLPTFKLCHVFFLSLIIATSDSKAPYSPLCTYSTNWTENLPAISAIRKCIAANFSDEE